MISLMTNPHTEAEWQQAFDAAVAARALADCAMYGLITGSPKIDVVRCDYIIERGRRRGMKPSKLTSELAVEFVMAVNAVVRP